MSLISLDFLGNVFNRRATCTKWLGCSQGLSVSKSMLKPINRFNDRLINQIVALILYSLRNKISYRKISNSIGAELIVFLFNIPRLKSYL